MTTGNDNTVFGNSAGEAALQLTNPQIVNTELWLEHVLVGFFGLLHFSKDLKDVGLGMTQTLLGQFDGDGLDLISDLKRCLDELALSVTVALVSTANVSDYTDGEFGFQFVLGTDCLHEALARGLCAEGQIRDSLRMILVCKQTLSDMESETPLHERMDLTLPEEAEQADSIRAIPFAVGAWSEDVEHLIHGIYTGDEISEIGSASDRWLSIADMTADFLEEENLSGLMESMTRHSDRACSIGGGCNLLWRALGPDSPFAGGDYRTRTPGTDAMGRALFDLMGLSL